MEYAVRGDWLYTEESIAIFVRIGSNMNMIAMMIVVMWSHVEVEARRATPNRGAFSKNSRYHEHRNQKCNKQDTNNFDIFSPFQVRVNVFIKYTSFVRIGYKLICLLIWDG
jgi:hypothetical protein